MKKTTPPKPKNLNSKLIMTPAGPRSRDQVRTVSQDEAIRMNASGKVVIEPRKEQPGTEGDREGDFVITPGGLRKRSLVHQIEPGQILKVVDGRHKVFHPSGKIAADYGLIPHRRGTGPLMPGNVSPVRLLVPALGTGWITYASWNNATGNPITRFTSLWAVPPAPSNQSGQLIYLFNGIQNATMIYQPVLQWGNNGAFGGNYWVVASWYADGQGGQAFNTQPVKVNPGDILTGVMALTKQSGTKFDYTCEFQGIANTSLPVNGIDELTWCCHTLEAYKNLQNCSSYPNTPYTAFQQIDIRTGATIPAVTWAPTDPITDCGQHTVVSSNANPGGDVSIYYRGVQAHDLFIRDNLQDFGSEPLIGGGLSCSPDIIVFNEELLDPQATLGSAAAMNQDTLGESVEFDQDNFLYFRVQNRGTQAASGTIKAYYASFSTWPVPSGWKLINTIAIPAVNPGQYKVVGPLKWLKGDLPPVGHYCFIALIGSADEPAPDPSSLHNWDEYYRFIRASNNATWKNFDVTPQLPGSYMTSDFQIQGWPRKKLSSDLLFDITALPGDYGVSLRILRRITEGAVLEHMELSEESELYRRYSLEPGKNSALMNMNLKASDTTIATLEISIPETAGDGHYRISIAQVVDGLEMGRVTRLVAVGQYPFIGNTNTKEVHIPGCDWVGRISPRHKVPYDSMERAIKRGYNGCRFCLPEYNTG